MTTHQDSHEDSLMNDLEDDDDAFDPRIGELEAANAEQSKLIAEYELEVKERGRQNRAQTEEISRLSKQLKDRDAQVLALREVLLGGKTAVIQSFTEACHLHMNDDDLAAKNAEAVQDWLNETKKALTSTADTAKSIEQRGSVTPHVGAQNDLIYVIDGPPSPGPYEGPIPKEYGPNVIWGPIPAEHVSTVTEVCAAIRAKIGGE